MTSSCLQKQLKTYVVVLVGSPKPQGIIIGPLLFFFFKYNLPSLFYEESFAVK